MNLYVNEQAGVVVGKQEGEGDRRIDIKADDGQRKDVWVGSTETKGC